MGRPPADLDDYLDWQERLETNTSVYETGPPSPRIGPRGPFPRDAGSCPNSTSPPQRATVISRLTRSQAHSSAPKFPCLLSSPLTPPHPPLPFFVSLRGNSFVTPAVPQWPCEATYREHPIP